MSVLNGYEISYFDKKFKKEPNIRFIKNQGKNRDRPKPGSVVKITYQVFFIPVFQSAVALEPSEEVSQEYTLGGIGVFDQTLLKMSKGQSVEIILPKDPSFNNVVDIDCYIYLKLDDFDQPPKKRQPAVYSSPRIENDEG